MAEAPDWITDEVDLTNCDREAIHLLGRVQDYGCLIAVSADWMIRHASTNVARLLGLTPETLLGRPLAEALGAASVSRLRERAEGLGRELDHTRLFGLKLGDWRYDVSVHRAGRGTILEFEPRVGDADPYDVNLVQPLMAAVRKQPDLPSAAAEAARVLRRLSGFERVKVYRFDTDGTGIVIAEDRVDDIESFQDLRFPASDIPAQARLLYTRSLLRLIADVDAETHPVLPHTSPEGEPLDMSLCVTRAVSPIHLQYLRNMGVKASMSVSILREGELWGLFACHSRTPHYIGFERRTAVELFAQLFSYELEAKQIQRSRLLDGEARLLHDGLMARLGRGDDIVAAIDVVAEEIRPVIPFDGIAVTSGGRYAARGHAPSMAEFRDLARFLNTAAASEVFQTRALHDAFPAAAGFAHPVAGLLALPISRESRDYIVLFRQEVARTVNWAGNPEKPVTHEAGEPAQLGPRASFATWQQEVRGQSIPWSEAERAAARALRVTLLEVVLRLTDEANHERARAEEKQAMLIGELNHRVRNILNLIRGLASQTRDRTTTLADYTRELDGRISALARAHDQLTRSEWEASSLRQLVELEMGAFGGMEGRIDFDGDDVLLSAEAFSTLALVLHEMVTNSAKYGALSVPEGRVDLALSRNDEGDLLMEWRDRGGPPVREPKRRGFGSTIIERAIPHELRGTSDLRFAPAGLEADFSIPSSHLTEARHETTPDAQDAGVEEDAPADVTVDGPVLVLDDNLIIAYDTADMLREMGVEHVSTVGTVDEGVASVDERRPVAALLDVNLGAKETSLPLARHLAQMGIRFAFTTGYSDDSEMLAEFADAPILRKPFDGADLRRALSALLR